jgi:hypothetical protein
LFENGFPLGPADSMHADIRAKGGGAHSHWGSHLYFSTSDGTDPRTNGRIYAYHVPGAADPTVRLIGHVLLGLSLLGLVATSLHRRSDKVASTAETAQTVQRYVGVLATAVGGAGLLYLTWLTITIPPRQGVIDTRAVSASAAKGYVTRIDTSARWPLRVAAGHGSSDRGSAITVTESAVPLSAFESDSAALLRGGGRYGLAIDQLTFSARDDTDPRTNGRTYSWYLPLEVTPEAWLLSLLLLVVGALLAFRQSVVDLAGWLLATSQNDLSVRNTAVHGLAVVLVCVITSGLVVYRWNWGPSALLGFKGYLPVSDALGYFWCAIASTGVETVAVPLLAPDWCARRVLYVTSLGAGLGLSGWRPQLVLLIQAIVIGAALAALAFVVARAFGRLAAMVSLVGLLLLAYALSLGNFMTESLGLALGLLGMSLLIGFAVDRRRLPLLYAGLAIFSIGMFARMGALLVLPTVGLWAWAVLFRSAHRPQVRAYIIALVAALAGPLLQVLLVLGVGVDPMNSGGNYATTLYGLSTGSRDWAQAYRDFDPEFKSSPETVAFAKVYAEAFANIRSNPGVFVESLAAGATTYLATAFVIGALIQYNLLLSALCLIGVAWCVVHLRNAAATLLLVVLVGEILSAPLVFIGPSDHRVLIVSAVARFVLVGVGFAWLCKVGLAFVALRGGRTNTIEATHVPGTALSATLGGLLIVTAVLPTTPVQKLFMLPAAQGHGCPSGQQELVARIGRESMALAIGNSASPIGRRALTLDPAQLNDDQEGRRAWWSSRLPELQTGTVLIYGIQLLPGARGAMVPLVFNGELPGGLDSPLSLCYDPAPTPIVIGDVVFRRVITARLMAGS